jgi:putative nucleotidyltransferase with HDIG domain
VVNKQDNRNIQVNMFSLIISLSNACDLVRPELFSHHKQVAYLSFKIAEKMNLPSDQCQNALLSGLLHDIGALSVNERLELLENEPLSMNDHAFIGASLLASFPPLAEMADTIRFHHLYWENGQGNHFQGKPVPLLSHILHLADRAVVLINPQKNILNQVNTICAKLQNQKNIMFHPEVFDAFAKLCQQEYIWLDLSSRSLTEILPGLAPFETMNLDLDQVIELTHIFAKVIDYRSQFTTNHSIGVAKTAERLAELTGFSENECKMMLIAGYLHDLGKLAVHNDILEKPGSLNEEDYNVIRSHTYYTYRLLQPIKNFETINQWAAFHHEKLNGNGYPFHLKDREIPLGSRIMAVADIFTAITEDRPYRKGMNKQQASDVLKGLVSNGAISEKIVSILLEHYEEINQLRQEAQFQAGLEYNYLMSQWRTL